MDKSKKILLVDDDPDFIETIKIVLESEKYEVITASGPEECFNRVSAETPDLIILDVLWPDRKSGFEVCRELKKDADLKNIPVIMLTSVDDKYGLGFKNVAGDETWLPSDDFLSKPVNPNLLISKVKEFLS